MKSFNAIVLTGALVACAASAAPTAQAPKPVSFMADAKVEVDPEGKLVKVEASADLPESVRHYIEQQVGKWTFKRNLREGETGNATTYLMLGACAVPTTGGGYSMGLAYHWAGPRVIGAGGRFPVSSELLSAVGRTRISAVTQVHFTVAADGTTHLDQVDGLHAREKKALEPPIKRWIEALRFDPETIGGKAVATRSTLPVEFKQYGGPEDLHPDPMVSPQCRQAGMGGGGMAPVAVDSVISVTPVI